MAGPFKLRSGNSPLFKTMGSSPVRYEKEKVGPRVEKDVKKEFIKKEVSPYTPPPKVPVGNGGNIKKNDPVKQPEDEIKKITKPPKKNIKKKKGTWFGMPDLGVTETTSRVIDYFMPKKAGPFKMKGSPMKRNFGVGSPMKQGRGIGKVPSWKVGKTVEMPHPPGKKTKTKKVSYAEAYKKADKDKYPTLESFTKAAKAYNLRKSHKQFL